MSRTVAVVVGFALFVSAIVFRINYLGTLAAAEVQPSHYVDVFWKTPDAARRAAQLTARNESLEPIASQRVDCYFDPREMKRVSQTRRHARELYILERPECRGWVAR